MFQTVKCLNPNCINTFERKKKGGHWKKFCNSKCRSQYHSNTSSKFATPYMLGQSMTDTITGTVTGTVNNAVGQMSGSIANRLVSGLENRLSNIGLPLPAYTIGGVVVSQLFANLFKVEDSKARGDLAVWFGIAGAALDFVFKDKPQAQQQLIEVPQVQVQQVQTLQSEITRKAKKGDYLSAKDYQKITIPRIPMSSEYDYLFGMPARDFYMVLHGLPGNGKTSFAVKFGQYFHSHHGKVLYLASEQNGIDLAFQDVLKRYKASFQLHTNPKQLTEEHLLAAFKSYDLIILDSATNLGFYPNQIKDLQEKSGKAVIAILQSTKDGKFKGSQEWLHDVDISLKIDDFQAILEKSRFNTSTNKTPTKGTTIPV